MPKKRFAAAFTPCARGISSWPPCPSLLSAADAMSYSPDNFLDTVEAAEVLKLSARTLEGYRWRGGGPPYCKIGKRRVVYLWKDLMAFALQQRRQNTGSGEMTQ